MCMCECVYFCIAGDHVLVGSYDRKLSWFDLDLSNKPYQTLKYVCSLNVVILCDK